MTREYGAGGFRYRVLFAKPGYTPHCAEHLIDPLDGREKLLMFDPHTRSSAIIYDLESKLIEWEAQVPGARVNNPHQGFMLEEGIHGLGEVGDVVCTDRENRIVVIDRETRRVKFSKHVPWGAKWVHCVYKAFSGSYIIATDYSAPRVSKLSLPDLKEEWARTDISRPSKISVIGGAGLFHDPSFGGHYLIPSNEPAPRGAVYEINDLNGSIAWRSPNERGEGAWISAPHSAFRLGRVECRGNVTVVGSEAEGGIVAINFDGDPIFGFSGSWVRHKDGDPRYCYSSLATAEVTHVFPTLSGGIGFVAWSGFNSSIVGEIISLPSKREVYYVPALSRGSLDTFADFVVYSAGWRELQVGIKNTGPHPIDYEVRGYMTEFVDFLSAPERGSFLQASGTIDAGGDYVDTFFESFSFLLIRVKSTKAGLSSTYDVFVVKRT